MVCKYLIIIVLLCTGYSVHAQFYTLKPKEHVSFRFVSSPVSSELKDTIEGKKHGIFSTYSPPLNCPLVINSKYGYRKDPISKSNKRKFHYGIDLSANGNTVMSMLAGEVRKTGYEKRGLGYYVTIRHGDFEVIYGHLSSILIKEKDKVLAGTPIGMTGNTGRSTGEHLHLGLKFKGKKVNPLPFLLFIQKRIPGSTDSHPVLSNTIIQ